MEIEVELTKNALLLRCDRRCRLLSHLLHRAGLDVHCRQDGTFSIYFNEYTIGEVLEAFEAICNNPVWIVEFAEKYVGNEFMMFQAFGTPETIQEGV